MLYFLTLGPHPAVLGYYSLRCLGDGLGTELVLAACKEIALTPVLSLWSSIIIRDCYLILLNNKTYEGKWKNIRVDSKFCCCIPSK